MTHCKDLRERTVWAWIALGAILIAGLDALTPPSVNVSVLGVGLVLFGLWSSRNSLIYFAAAVGTSLALLGLVLWPVGPTVFWEAAVNRLLSIAVIWTTASLCFQHKRKSAEDALDRLKRERATAEKELAARKRRELTATQEVIFYTLANLAESRDSDTGHHVERVRAYCQILAVELRKDPAFARVIDDQFLDDLHRCSPLHDIGKVATPDSVLLKTGPLTPEEFELMKRHTVLGSNILEEAISRKQEADFLTMGALIARCHHERFDGLGYPAGLSGRAIPLPARIVALADVFDALISQRPYKEPLSPDEVRNIIVAESGRQFDPVVVDAFQRRFGDFLHVQVQYPSKHTRIFGIAESLLAEMSEPQPQLAT